MPRYFFDFADGHRDVDVEGTDLLDLQTARNEAVMVGAALLRDKPSELWATGEFRVEVRDDSRALLFTVAVTLIEP